MTYNPAVKFIDELGVAYGVKHIDNKPRVSSIPYLYDIAEEEVAGHVSFRKMGYTPTMTTAISDIWSAAGVYTFPTAAAGMELLSSNNVDDIGTSIFSGNSTGGSTTTLIDTAKDFTGGTPVAVGDCVILDKSGASPEYGYVTGVAVTTLTLASGFSSGGSGAGGRAYTVIDYSATAGAHAVGINYLDGSYAEKMEIAVLNGTTVVPTVNLDLFRINDFFIVATGSSGKSTGNLTIRNLADTPIYGYILAGYNAMRSSVYTVPASKTLYIVSICLSYGYSTNQTHYSRLFARASQDENGFVNKQPIRIFYPFAEVVCANTSQFLDLPSPTKLGEGTDLKVSGIATFSGIANCVIRGWIE